MSSDATYTLVGNEENGDWVVFIGNGKEVSAKGYTILASKIGNVVLELKQGELLLNNEVPVSIRYKNLEKKFDTGTLRKIVIE